MILRSYNQDVNALFVHRFTKQWLAEPKEGGNWTNTQNQSYFAQNIPDITIIDKLLT